MATARALIPTRRSLTVGARLEDIAVTASDAMAVTAMATEVTASRAHRTKDVDWRELERGPMLPLYGTATGAAVAQAALAPTERPVLLHTRSAN